MYGGIGQQPSGTDESLGLGLKRGRRAEAAPPVTFVTYVFANVSKVWSI